MHVHWFGQNEARHIHEPATSGKGLGVHPTGSFHYAQINLSAGDRLLFYGRAPSAWDSTLDDPSPSSMDALRRRLAAIPDEIEKEKAAILKRFSDPQTRMFPVAVMFLVPVKMR